MHIRNLTQALCRELVLKKVHEFIKFNQKAWLKSYIDMNKELRNNAKNDSEKDFFKRMNDAVFGKTIPNVRKHRDIKLEHRRKKELFTARSKLSYIKFFF